MSEKKYKDFLNEVYIEPIRSVLIVDDHYPTLDNLIDRNKLVENSKFDETFKKVIESFRQKKWLIDINNGENIDELMKDGNYFNHSDLLILDYQLEGEIKGGEKSLSIIQNLAVNSHFNLVVVHTQKDIQEVFNEIVLKLIKPCEIFEHFNDINNELEEWEDLQEIELKKKILEVFDNNLFLEIFRDYDFCIKELHNNEGGRFHQVKSIYESKPENISLQLKKFFNWAIKEKQKSIFEKLDKIGLDDLSWKFKSNEQNWIRSNSVFITVVSKSETHTTLNTKLVQALELWNPQPARVILSKIRTEIVKNGVNAEDIALDDKYLQAGWYKNLINSNLNEIDVEIDLSLRRYSEDFLSQVQKNVTQFTKDLCELHNSDCENCVIKSYFGIDLTKEEETRKSLIKQNIYNCSKNIEGTHLSTGHIFQLEKEYWVCLSPACDLVPNQKNTGRFKSVKPALPFIAVKLTNIDTKKALKIANDNLYIFLNIDGKEKAFSFVENALSNPTWESIFAKEGGKWSNSDFKLQVGKSKWTKNTIVTEWFEATIVAQLRYEYALNLLHRLGYSLSRVGLDFISYNNE